MKSKGRFHVEHIRNGVVVDKFDVTNDITTEGRNFHVDIDNIREGFHITDTQTKGRTMKFPPFPHLSKCVFIEKCRFTFLPRRITTHYWDDRDLLICVTWWQWFHHCFRTRDRIIVRPSFSSWKQITNRMNNGDLDAKLIYTCLEVMQSRKYDHLEPKEEIYNKLVAGVGFEGAK